MAAGQGFKTFTTGEVLTAADTNGYLMQGVLVFADAAARSTAITSPQEGQTSYLKDTDVIQVYSGSTWVTKSGSSPLTTKGDLYTYSTTDARLGVGANDTVLTADSTAATGLKWATPATGSMTLLSTTTLSGATTTISSISQSYKHLYALITAVNGSGNFSFYAAPNGTTNISNSIFAQNSILDQTSNSYIELGRNRASANTANALSFTIENYTSTTERKSFSNYGGYSNTASGTYGGWFCFGFIQSTSAVSSLVFSHNTTSFNGGTVYLYGVN